MNEDSQQREESIIKSPTRSDILKTLYNDYANLKNKQLACGSFSTLNAS